ncbi:MAG: 1-deoxy-D-xylulose-5-phosphate synthase, partial [Propionibacteriaceae bacterium]|nr:1-deoxy-D-xylulose-5-phosphate synthase [Propionibacteriaceae bacterium]
DGLDILTPGDDVLLVAYGDMVPVALAAAEQLPMGVSVVDPVWALPVSESLVKLAGKYRLVVSVEDDVVVGGLGQRLRLAMEQAGIDVPTRCLGLPDDYLPAGSREQVLSNAGLDVAGVTAAVNAMWASLAVKG